MTVDTLYGVRETERPLVVRSGRSRDGGGEGRHDKIYPLDLGVHQGLGNFTQVLLTFRLSN